VRHKSSQRARSAQAIRALFDGFAAPEIPKNKMQPTAASAAGYQRIRWRRGQARALLVPAAALSATRLALLAELSCRAVHGMQRIIPAEGPAGVLREYSSTNSCRLRGYPTGTQKIFTCVNYEASMNSRTESTDAREGKKL